MSAARALPKALRGSAVRGFSSRASAVSRRTFVSAAAARPAVAAASRSAFAAPAAQQTRGIKTIDFAGTKETVYGEFFPFFISPVAMR